VKKCFALFMILALVLSCPSAFSESSYQPKMNMTMDDFINQYNAIASPLGSPLKLIEKPYQWTLWDKYGVAWFGADSKSGVTILLESSDPQSSIQSTSCGLDRIQIYCDKKDDLLPLIAISCRCISLFSPKVFTLDTSYYFVSEILTLYYENNCQERNLSYQRQMEADGTMYVRFFHDSGYYYFEILDESDL